MRKNLYSEALHVAQTYDVATSKNSLVVYSVSFLPTKENRDKAFDYVKKHKKAMLLDHTDCGAKLIEMGLNSGDCGLKQEEVFSVWRKASQRLIEQASGNITAFVEGADPRSTFITIELPCILVNPKIKTINGVAKEKFGLD